MATDLASSLSSLLPGSGRSWQEQVFAQYERSTKLTTQAGEGKPLEGAELPWEDWLRTYFPHVASKPLAQRHVNLWQWGDNLKPSVKPAPFVALWARGGGKSSSIELLTARLCATLQRRFVLYLSGTQDQARKHVQAVASLMEHMGVERQLNPYGHSKGWRQDQLRTANGFNVAAIGRDVAVRGIKLDHFRPDLILIDDIDSALDSPEETQKTIDLITKSILPAGSPDCAVAFVQNVIHSGSIANKLLNRTAGFLIGAQVDGPHPAIDGLAYEKLPDTTNEETGEVTEGRYRITAGTATWDGQPLALCEEQLNEWGPDAFEVEAQHNLKFAKIFFPDYDQDRHLKPPIFLPVAENGAHLPHWYTFFGGLDWGFSDPYGWVVQCMDESGRVHVLECYQEAKLTNQEQAQKLKDALIAWGIPLNRCPITYDPTMDNEKTFNGVKAEPDIKAYLDAGLYMRPADRRADSTQHGWNKCREFLKREDGLIIYRGRCSRLAEYIQDAKPKKLRPEELEHDSKSHILHAWLYSMVGQFGLANPPESPAEREKQYEGSSLDLVGFEQYKQKFRQASPANHSRGKHYV